MNQFYSHYTTATPPWQNQFGNFIQLDHRGWPVNWNHLNDGHYSGDPN